MTVKYATQVLSKTVAVALSTFGADDTKETATFCTLMDSWFDCFNTRNLEEANEKENLFYNHIDTQVIPSLIGWKMFFLKYFEVWDESVRKREGDFSNLPERKCLFLNKLIMD